MSKVWLVTGASRGLGREIVRAALAAGHRVVAGARNPPEDTGSGQLLNVALDVTDETDARDAVDAAIGTFGRLDVLVNNAGYGQIGAFEETTPEEVHRQFEVNVFGAMNLTRAALPVMRSQRSGHIFTVSSLGGYGGVNRGTVYGASKFALVGFTEALAAEVAEFGITATCVAPGYFRTDFLDPSSLGSGTGTPIDDYRESTARYRQELTAANHLQPGDPAKLARLLVELAATAEPPLHFPAGKDAVAFITHHHEQLLAGLKPWRALSESTDHG